MTYKLILFCLFNFFILYDSALKAEPLSGDIDKQFNMSLSSNHNAFENCLKFESTINECRLRFNNTHNSQEKSLLSTSAAYFYQNHQHLTRDPLNYLTRESTKLISQELSKAVNNQIRKIPFFAQTTVGADYTQGSAASYYLDSFMKLAELGKDNDGYSKGIVFAQARYSAAYGFQGSTVNTGIGSRYRLSNNSMLGINGFWDYRIMTSYTSHSRFGVGAELFYSDLEIRNNWYIAGTGVKTLYSDSGTTTYERVVPGWDVELGYRLPSYPQLGIFLKGFNWDYVSRPDNYGIGASINWQATPHFNLETSVSNEVPTYLTYTPSNNNTDVFVGVKVKYTFNPVEITVNDKRKKLVQLLSQPVRRRYDVLLERYSTNSTTGFSAIVVAQ